MLTLHNGSYRKLLDLPDALFEGPLTRLEDIARYNIERGEYGDVTLADYMQRTRERVAMGSIGGYERVRKDGTTMSLAQTKRANELEKDMNAWEENRLITSGVVRLKEVRPGTLAHEPWSPNPEP